MKVYRAYDRLLRVRIGHELLGSESLGSWYGGTGAIRLRQLRDGWFHAYQLDVNGYRGSSTLPGAEFARVQAEIPSARVVGESGINLDVRISDDDVRNLEGAVLPLLTRIARLDGGVVAMFGDFQIAPVADARIGLFHLGGTRLNGFRIGFRYTALRQRDLAEVAAHLPSARLIREGQQTMIDVSEAELIRLQTAEDFRSTKDGMG
ncbi:hypothetical protein [Falsiroseomonas sp. HW251]|uniref:hypothetical protein n=1 Tax=Falsiroseomonas sp. HW251 TaxID=3390998 RepID=UPI003D316941